MPDTDKLAAKLAEELPRISNSEAEWHELLTEKPELAQRLWELWMAPSPRSIDQCRTLGHRWVRQLDTSYHCACGTSRQEKNGRRYYTYPEGWAV